MNCLNNKLRQAISKSIHNDTLSHAYIICGGDQESRHEYIMHIIKEIFCIQSEDAPCNDCINCRKISNGNMEDLIVIKKAGQSIKADQIKELAVVLSNKPFAARTVAVIDEADTMTPESQNKLLKNLEEPAPGTVIFLSAESLFALYPTIRSRCIIVNIGHTDFNHDPELEERAANIVKYSMSNKPLNTIYREVNEYVDTGNQARNLLDVLEIFVRDIAVGKYSAQLLLNENHKSIVERIDWSKGYPFEGYLKHIESAKTELRKNLNWKYTIKNMIINFKQEELNG